MYITFANGVTAMAEENQGYATSATMAAVIFGLSITQNMTAADQTAVSNLLLAAAQAISTRASLLPEGTASRNVFERLERLEKGAP